MKTVIVTGGAGFIGSALIQHFLSENIFRVVNIDKLTYAGNLNELRQFDDNPNYVFHKVDICDRERVDSIFREFKPNGIIHLAAESHVDRSIGSSSQFIETNILGTHTLLEASRSYWLSLSENKKLQFRFHHVSTDEVYGSLGNTGLFTETNPYQPNSPYSASKAASDHLVRAWYKTYGLPVVTTHSSNNYGPRQYPEKLIPLMILNGLSRKPLPIYGSGDNIRDWLYVDDHVTALRLVFEKGLIGEVYNIGGHEEKSNLEVVDKLCNILDKLKPLEGGQKYSSLKSYVPDRPGHDKRYAIDASKLSQTLGWKPVVDFDSGLLKTVQWYLDNFEWLSRTAYGVCR